MKSKKLNNIVRYVSARDQLLRKISHMHMVTLLWFDNHNTGCENVRKKLLVERTQFDRNPKMYVTVWCSLSSYSIPNVHCLNEAISTIRVLTLLYTIITSWVKSWSKNGSSFLLMYYNDFNWIHYSHWYFVFSHMRANDKEKLIF